MDDGNFALAIISMIAPFIALLVLDEWRHRTKQPGRHKLHKESLRDCDLRAGSIKYGLLPLR
jgi:hypothetical protein